MPKLKHLLIALLIGLAPMAWAVQPDEILSDPELEARARALSKELRCVVCRNENIDNSNAEVARDLRLFLRERLIAGDSDEEALAQITDRYGEFVLFKPPLRGSNLILWGSGPIVLLLGGLIIWISLRAKRQNKESALSLEEEEALQKLLAEPTDQGK